MEKLQNILDIVSAKRRISKKVVSWGGLLCHCAHVIRGGRVFCKRTFKLGIIKSKIHNYDRFSSSGPLLVAKILMGLLRL